MIERDAWNFLWFSFLTKTNLFSIYHAKYQIFFFRFFSRRDIQSCEEICVLWSIDFVIQTWRPRSAFQRARWNTLRTKKNPFYFRHVHNWSWLLCCHGKVPFSSETDGYLGSSLLLPTDVPFLFAGWLMKGMEKPGRKNTEYPLVHEKSKLFFPRIVLSLVYFFTLMPLFHPIRPMDAR